MTVALAVNVGARRVTFIAPDDKARLRVESLYTKEPETIAWLDAMPAGSVLWDIGASNGVYALYAAALGHVVFAFEPEPDLHRAILKGGARSGLGGLIHSFPMALDDTLSIDSLSLIPPTHIKIDTDGRELAIVRGAEKTLAGVRSVLVETDDGQPDDQAEIRRLLGEAGLSMRARHVCPFTPRSPVGVDHWFRS